MSGSLVKFMRYLLITGIVTRITRRMPLVEQKLFRLPEHLRSPAVFSGVRVTLSLVLYVCFVDRCLSFCTFSFGHCVVCPSSIYRFWLPPFSILKHFLFCVHLHMIYIFLINCLLLNIVISSRYWKEVDSGWSTTQSRSNN
jgi:hypothetical protein